MPPRFRNREMKAIWDKVGDLDAKVSKLGTDMAVIKNDMCWIKKFVWRFWIPIIIYIVGSSVVLIVRVVG